MRSEIVLDHSKNSGRGSDTRRSYDGSILIVMDALMLELKYTSFVELCFNTVTQPSYLQLACNMLNTVRLCNMVFIVTLYSFVLTWFHSI